MTPETDILKQAASAASRDTQYEEAQTPTQITVSELAVSALKREACLVQIYPTGQGMGSRYNLKESTLVVGRANECDICLEELSVSRQHVRIQPGMDGF